MENRLPCLETSAAETARHFKRNAWAHCLDGAFFALGVNFVSLNSILPVFVSTLTESKVLIGLISTITVIGNSVPQLIAANAGRRYERKKDLLLRYAIGQRIPWLLMALNAYLIIPRSLPLGLIWFFITYAMYTVASGLAIPVWFDTIVKGFPPDRRGRVLGIRSFATGAASVIAGYAAGRIIREMAYPNNFSLLFLLAFIGTSTSLIAFIRIWEPRQPVSGNGGSIFDYVRELPCILRNDRNFATYLIANAIIGFAGMAGTFYTVYALDRLRLAADAAGTFAAVTLASQTLSSLLWGRLGDRLGYKRVLEISLLLTGLAAILAVFAESYWFFIPVFVTFGAATGGTAFAGLNVITEMCDPENRLTYVSLSSTCNAPVAGLSPLLGGVLADHFGYRPVFLMAAVMVMGGLALLAAKVKAKRVVAYGR